MPTNSGLLKSQIDELTIKMHNRVTLLGPLYFRDHSDVEWDLMFKERLYLKRQLKKLNDRNLKGKK
jgi:hypothetical protein